MRDAIAHYRAALRIKPDYADAHTNLGMLLARTPGNLPQAISEFQAALTLQPQSAAAHSNLALAFSLAGRPADALSEFEASYRIKPDPAVRHDLDNLRASRHQVAALIQQMPHLLFLGSQVPFRRFVRGDDARNALGDVDSSALQSRDLIRIVG